MNVRPYTAAHELTHLIKDMSAVKFDTLADFLVEQYHKKGVDVSELIEAQIEKAREDGRMLRLTDNKHKGEREYDHRSIGLAYGAEVDLNEMGGYDVRLNKIICYVEIQLLTQKA